LEVLVALEQEWVLLVVIIMLIAAVLLVAQAEFIPLMLEVLAVLVVVGAHLAQQVEQVQPQIQGQQVAQQAMLQAAMDLLHGQLLEID
jgi:hypothetical protein